MNDEQRSNHTFTIRGTQPGHHDSHDDGSKTVLGFWIYLMSDCLIFSVLFATFGVLAGNTAGGPSGKELFDLPYVAGETLLLLISSFTFGMAMLNMHARRQEQGDRLARRLHFCSAQASSAWNCTSSRT